MQHEFRPLFMAQPLARAMPSTKPLARQILIRKALFSYIDIVTLNNRYRCRRECAPPHRFGPYGVSLGAGKPLENNGMHRSALINGIRLCSALAHAVLNGLH